MCKLPVLNDIHARLNRSRPALYRRPDSIAGIFETLRQARRRGLSVAIAGGRHAMGGQQFIEGGCVLDMRALNRIVDFDSDSGLITVQAGATWPATSPCRRASLDNGEFGKSKPAPIR